MISEPGRYLKRFREAGADLMTVHVEVAEDARGLLREIRSLGAVAGLTLNPPTPVEHVEPYLDDCDLLLVMSVMPGFGGQEFEPLAIDRLRHLRAIGRSESAAFCRRGHQRAYDRRLCRGRRGPVRHRFGPVWPSRLPPGDGKNSRPGRRPPRRVLREFGRGLEHKNIQV